MKLATIRPDPPRTVSERRDGRLAVVDDANGRAAIVAADIAPNLLAALDAWESVEPELRRIDQRLRAGQWPEARPLHELAFMAPLPRTWAWLDGSAFLHHVRLARKARGAEPPADLETVPLMYQGASDNLLGPRDDIAVGSEEYGIDFEAELGVIVDDVPMGTSAADARGHIKLLVLMNDVSLRNLIPAELARGFGFFQGKPPTSFAPYAVTPDELAGAWRNGRVHLDVTVHLNGERFGNPDAGQMHFTFNDLIQFAARTRPLSAGTIVGAGTVSNPDESRGSCCIVERRMIETIRDGGPRTPFMRYGDRVQVQVLHNDRSVFGAIDQRVAPYRPAADSQGGKP